MLPHFLSEYPSVTSPPTKFQKAISVYQRTDIKKTLFQFFQIYAEEIKAAR